MRATEDDVVTRTTDMSEERVDRDVSGGGADDTVQRADSGHPGLPLGAADYAWQLWQHHLNFSY